MRLSVAFGLVCLMGAVDASLGQTPSVGIDGYVRPGVGLVIREVFPGSLAQESGLLAGDTIVSANDQAIGTAEDFRSALRRGGRVRLLVARGSRTVPMVIDLSADNPANPPAAPPAAMPPALYPESANAPRVVTPPPGVLLPRLAEPNGGVSTGGPMSDPSRPILPPTRSEGAPSSPRPPIAAGAGGPVFPVLPPAVGPGVTMSLPAATIEQFVAALLPYTVTGNEPISFDAPVVGRVNLSLAWSATVQAARITLTEQGATIDADVALQAGPIQYQDRVRGDLAIEIDPATRELVVTVQKAFINLRFREGSAQTVALDLSRQLKPFRLPLKFLDQTVQVGPDRAVLVQANPTLTFTAGALLISSPLTITPAAPRRLPPGSGSL